MPQDNERLTGEVSRRILGPHDPVITELIESLGVMPEIVKGVRFEAMAGEFPTITLTCYVGEFVRGSLEKIASKVK